MIIYTDPDTGYICKAANAIGITAPYREAPSHERNEFNEAISDYDAAGAPVYDLPKAKAIKIKGANKACDDSLKVITDNYSEAEMKTWSIQEAEARNYVADIAANVTVRPTPFLDGLSAGTGIALSDLANKVILKADGFKLLSATAVGKRQAMETSATSATDIATLKAVTF